MVSRGCRSAIQVQCVPCQEGPRTNHILNGSAMQHQGAKALWLPMQAPMQHHCSSAAVKRQCDAQTGTPFSRLKRRVAGSPAAARDIAHEAPNHPTDHFISQ
uniref:Uncharacterized protein n=1 Tax=Eutreptiella gymnastica TaxID=73025 RepID=A0A7S4CAW4_9EUGL|mmetsp:Transcript_98398/g.165663  ORF Transcript_98398/g.165663 Transcript_98398/m.165663 type:complete len:102 (+) Transcript_98398:252-557(+)